MLDSVVIDHYLDAGRRHDLKEKVQWKAAAATVAVEVLKAFREDLRYASSQISTFREKLADAGFAMTSVRILEVLIWTERESNGYYRDR